MQKRQKKILSLVGIVALMVCFVFALSACTNNDNTGETPDGEQPGDITTGISVAKTNLVFRKSSKPDAEYLGFDLPEKREFYLYLFVDIKNDSDASEAVSVKFYVYNADDFKVDSLGGDAEPTKQRVNREGIDCWEFSGISWSAAAGSEVQKKIILKFFAREPGDAEMSVEYSGDRLINTTRYVQKYTFVESVLIPLSQPILSVQGEDLVWAAVPNAALYYVNVDGIGLVPVEDTRYSLATLAPGAHTIDVTAQSTEGSIYIASAASKKTVTKLAEPGGFDVMADGTLTWQAVTGATGYRVHYNDSYLDVANPQEALPFLSAPGTYEVCVRAITNAGDYVMSNKTKTIQITRLAAPVISISAPNIVWNKVENASGYKVLMDGVQVGDIITDTKFRMPGGSIGKPIVVVAVGAGNSVIDSQQSNSVLSTMG